MTKVLVVEDQPSVVSIIRYHLENEGFTGLFAEDVQEGWQTLVSEVPDAVVMDIRLPGAEGWTLIERIRNDGRYHDMPVVILTGLLEPEVVERAASLRCDYLSKPFAATALLTKIRALIKSRQEGSPPPPPGTVGTTRSHVAMVAVGVVILLDHYRIEGTVYLPPELARFSDAWESIVRDPRSFFPVTEARITSNGEVLATPGFMEVRKADVRAVFPEEAST
ncbi:MAG: response regulator [Actinomycetota bacterium]